MPTIENETSAEVETLQTTITAECKSLEDTLSSELQLARDRQMTTEHIAELEQRLQKAKDLNITTLKDLETRLQQARAREAEQQKAEASKIAVKAEESKAAMKKEMRTAWIDAGGDLEGFEAAFPQLYQAEMIKRTQANIHQSEKELTKSVRLNL